MWESNGNAMLKALVYMAVHEVDRWGRMNHGSYWGDIPPEIRNALIELDDWLGSWPPGFQDLRKDQQFMEEFFGLDFGKLEPEISHDPDQLELLGINQGSES